MEEKKSIIKKFLIISVILIFSIIIILFNNKETSELEYSNILISEENINTNEEKNEIDKKEISNRIKVYVTGEVKHQGVIELDEGARIEDAIIIAGGITEFADLSQVNLAYCLEDEQKLYIPSINDKNEVEYISEENGQNVIENPKKKNGKININTSGIDELCTLTGVGESLAQRIINYREENGKFKECEELKNVSGIGDKKYESLKEQVTVK